MSYTTVLNQVIILFAILLIGFFARFKKILTQEANKGLTDFLLNITIPFTIISSFNKDFPKSALVTAGMVFIFSFLLHLVFILVGWVICRKFEVAEKKVLWFITVFSNCGFMGMPVMQSINPERGVFYSSIYIVSFNLFVWTFGQALFSGVKDMKALRNAVLNPGIISVLAGLALFISPVRLPSVLARIMDMMGGLTTPLSMIIVGSMLAEVQIKEIFKGRLIYIGTAVRLFLMPLLTLTLLKLIGVHGDVLQVCVVSAAMPAAANTVIFAEKFGADSLLASRCVFLTTAISILTIPAILLFL